MESNTTTLNILTSHAEIALGFLLIVSLLSSVSQSFPFISPLMFSWCWSFCLKDIEFFLVLYSWTIMQVAAQHNTDFHVLAGLFHIYLNMYLCWDSCLINIVLDSELLFACASFLKQGRTWFLCCGIFKFCYVAVSTTVSIFPKYLLSMLSHKLMPHVMCEFIKGKTYLLCK